VEEERQMTGLTQGGAYKIFFRMLFSSYFHRLLGKKEGEGGEGGRRRRS